MRLEAGVDGNAQRRIAGRDRDHFLHLRMAALLRGRQRGLQAALHR